MPLGLNPDKILGKSCIIKGKSVIVLEYRCECDYQVLVTNHGSIEINWTVPMIDWDDEFENYIKN